MPINDPDEYREYRIGYIEDLEATAQRLRKLLRRCEWDYSGHCLICGNKEDKGHAADCELAEELGGKDG